MWSQAQALANDESAIVQCPDDPSAWVAKSSTGKRPHLVKASKTAGGYIRDEDCISYKSAKICSHTVAVALKCKQVDELVQWCQTGG